MQPAVRACLVCCLAAAAVLLCLQVADVQLAGSGAVGAAAGTPQQQQQQQQQQQVPDCVLRRAASAAASWLRTTGASPPTDPPGAARSLRASQGVSAQVDASKPTTYGFIRATNGGRRVPETFLATSHEWTRLTDYGGANAAAWSEIFKVLGPSPVLRLGGATQDKLVDPPKDETWVALARLQKLTGARFIIGLPLAQKNAIEMSQQMIGRARKYLGSAVLGYELGNEPEFWLSGLGGWSANGTWQAGFGPYSQWFDRVARTLNPCGTQPFLSGPGWGNVNTQDLNWMKILLDNGKACGYLWEASVHYYPYIDNTTVSAEQLLAQPLQDFGIERFKAYVRIATDGRGLPLRVSEANSLYGGGRAGLSDTMAGTLWVADALFAFASAGARAFHLHWGHGGLPFEGGAPNVGVQTNFDYNTAPPYVPYPSVHAPWYGYLFWVVASAGGYTRNADTQFVAAYIDRNPPAGLRPAAPAAAPAAANKTSGPPAPANVITEKGAAGANASSNGAKASSNGAKASSNGAKASSNGAKASSNGNTTSANGATTSSNGATTSAKSGAQGRRRRLQQASAAPCDANIKMWALKADDGSLRVAVLNKDTKQACNVRVQVLDAPQYCRAGQRAELSRLLPGPEGINSKGGMEWQGQHYEDAAVATTGKLVGAKQIAAVTAATDAAGCAYMLGMPTASAALLVLK